MKEGPAESSEQRLLGRYDLHCHTTMSDGSVNLEEVVEIAQRRGVTIGIADHVSTRNSKVFISTLGRLATYLHALEAAPVFRSAEFCWCDPFAAGLAREILNRFDYLVGSNHGFQLPDGSLGSPWWKTLPAAWADRPQELMEIMVSNLCDLVAGMPVAIVAHPTLTPHALLRLDPEVHTWWSEEREDRLIDAVVKAGVALEISNRYQLPHDRLLRKAREAGARFSLGSDGHTREQIARLEWSVAAAERAGITDEMLFIPERKR